MKKVTASYVFFVLASFSLLGSTLIDSAPHSEPTSPNVAGELAYQPPAKPSPQ